MTPAEQSVIVPRLADDVKTLSSDLKTLSIDVRSLHDDVAAILVDSEIREKNRDKRFKLALVVVPAVVVSTLGLLGAMVQAHATTTAARIEAGAK